MRCENEHIQRTYTKCSVCVNETQFVSFSSHHRLFITFFAFKVIATCSSFSIHLLPYIETNAVLCV